MNIIVTGGAGFIASHIADALIEQDHTITIVDNLSTGKLDNVPSKAHFIELDITSDEMEDVFAEGDFNAIYHFAAQIDVRSSVRDPIADLNVNIGGSVKLLSLSVKYKVNHFIFASTGGVIYGEQEVFPATEVHPTRPICPYGVAKLAVERYMYFFYNEYGLNTIALRLGNVFGPRQNPFGEAGVVAIFTHQMLTGEQSYINGDGLQTKDYIYIKDVVRANLMALEQEGFHAFNIGTGRETDVATIFESLKRLTDSKAERKHKPPAPGEQRRGCIDSALARKLMNWTPEYTFEEGMKLTVEYFRNNPLER